MDKRDLYAIETYRSRTGETRGYNILESVGEAVVNVTQGLANVSGLAYDTLRRCVMIHRIQDDRDALERLERGTARTIKTL